MAAEVYASDCLLSDVAALGVRDRAELVEIRFLWKCRVIHVGAPLRTTTFDAGNFPGVFSSRRYARRLKPPFEQADGFTRDQDVESLEIHLRNAGDNHRHVSERPADVTIGCKRREILVVDIHHSRDYRSRRASKDSEVAELGGEIVIRRETRVDVLPHHLLPAGCSGGRSIDQQ